MNRNSKSLQLFLATACAVALLAVPATAEVITYPDCWGQAGFNLVSTDGMGAEIVFSVPQFELTEMMLDGEIMQNVTIPGVILPNNAGAPNLPGMGRFVALPQGAWAELELVAYRSEVFTDVNIAPAFVIPKGNDDSPLHYEKDLNIYGINADYPAEPVLISEVTSMRGVDVVRVGITPFQYNPVTKDLTVYKDLRVRVNFYGGNGHFGEDRLRSRWWEPILQQNLLNYQSLPEVNLHPEPPATDEDNVEYIIIVPDDPDFLAWADTLKQWRNQQGIITGITTLTEIGGNNATLIENYIDNAYLHWAIPPVAVLLLSDYQSTGDLYGITAPSYSGVPSDNVYADIDGDNLPELIMGRITAQDNNDLSTMINKMLSYERSPYTDPGFYDDPLIAGGWQSDRWFILCCDVIWGYFNYEQGKRPERQYAGYSGGAPSSWSSNSNTYMIIDYFGPSGLGYIPLTPAHLTDWTGSATGINNAINNGTFIVQHRDHGSPTSWGDPAYNISNINQLTNTMYPYVFSINCSTGEYDNPSECFAEAFHRSQYGALGIIAASGTSYSFVNDTFVWGMYDSMWPDFDPGYGADPIGETNLRPGFANASGKHYLEASNWPSNPSSKNITYHLFHHHGDAFMTLYSEVPQNLTVLHNSAILGGINEFTVTTDAGALIGLSVDGAYLAAAEATGGPVTLTFDPLTPGQVMRVTVTKCNYYRYVSDVDVIPPSGPYVIADECVVADAASWCPNAQLDYDEDVLLTLTMQNIGVEDALNVNVTITTEDLLLTIVDGSEYYGTIAASSTVTVTEGFEVIADPTTPDDHIFTVNVTATSGINVWESSFALIGHAPVLVLDRLEFDDPGGNNNGWLDPGETADMEVFLTNDGSSPGVLMSGNLTSLDPYLTVNSPIGAYGTIEPGVTGSAVFNVTADASTPQEHLADVSVLVSGDHSFDATVDFQVMIGNLLYDPTGPDNYGYLAYDPFDAPENPVYDWVEISADSGGPGTRVNITTDDTTFVFPLPFTFQYYGVEYNDYTVAANGWMGMGEVRGDDYSNSGIPDSDGPAPFIAPYWEDLSPQRTNSGGVWYWNDVAEHRLIVEWNHVEQYAPTGAFETFQVILLDPAYYQTSSGDGRILFQYKDMSSTAINTEGTVGIEDHSETDGIQYFFDGAYDVHAHHVEDGFVILYSTISSGPEINVDLTYVSGSPVPEGGGNVYYELFMENTGSVALSFDIWLDISYEGGAPTTLAQRYLTNFGAGWSITRPDMYFPTPASYPAGHYSFGCKVGDHPSTIWAEDSFPFVKTGVYSGSNVTLFIPAGMPDPFNLINTGEPEIALPEEFEVLGAYPNPFNPTSTIRFALPEASKVSLQVFDVSGRLVRTLVDGNRTAGIHSATFDATGMASGIYIYRIDVGEFTESGKMILMK